MSPTLDRFIDLGPTRLYIDEPPSFGLIIRGSAAHDAPSTPYLDPVFADPEAREAFFVLVEAHGVVAARRLAIDEKPYRFVRGKRSRGRLTKGSSSTTTAAPVP